jgi:hypothetical protein
MWPVLLGPHHRNEAGEDPLRNAKTDPQGRHNSGLTAPTVLLTETDAPLHNRA